eukprot:m.200301 g.200301  ORF g.200301 m.200301 type:complete len:322 (-) comp17692_c1_seq7:638-1603(-)
MQHTCSGLRPLRSALETGTFASQMRNFAMSVWPSRQAISSGVTPLSEGWSGRLPPSSTRKRTTSSRPATQATCSGISPSFEHEPADHGHAAAEAGCAQRAAELAADGVWALLARCEEEAANLCVAHHAAEMQRCDVVGVRDEAVCSGRDEEMDGLFATTGASEEERRLAVGVDGVDAGAGRQQQAQQRHTAASSSCMQGCSAVLGSVVDVGVAAQQQVPRDNRVAFVAGKDQRRGANLRLGVDLDFHVLDEETDNGQVALHGGSMQRAQPALGAEARVGAVLGDERHNIVELAAHACIEQSSVDDRLRELGGSPRGLWRGS